MAVSGSEVGPNHDLTYAGSTSRAFYLNVHNDADGNLLSPPTTEPGGLAKITDAANGYVLGNTGWGLTTYGSLKNIPGTTGGIFSSFKEATGTPSASTTYFDIPTLVDGTVRLMGVQLRVDTALTAGETWSAAFTNGSTTPIITTGQAVAKNTKIYTMIVPEITTNVTNVRITRDSGNFTNGVGVIRAIVYYDYFLTIADK